MTSSFGPIIGYKIFNMETPPLKIEDIQANYDKIFELVGQDSYVNWDIFTKTSTELSKSIDELIRGLSIYKQIQQKRFLIAMKKLKSTDIPDLLKTVKAKKLPKEALKSILSKFSYDAQGKLQLVSSAADLKAESQATLQAYASSNIQLTKTVKEATGAIAEKINESGLYSQPAPPKELVSTFKFSFSQELLDSIKKQIKIEYIPGTDQINIQTYGQIIHNTFPLVKDQYRRLTYESRVKQREVMGDSKKYVEALMEYLTNSEVIIIQGSRAIVKAIGLTQKKVEESEVALMEKGLAQTILLIQTGMRSAIKDSLPPQNDVSFDSTKKIIKTQIGLVKEKTPFFKQMLNNLEKTPQNFQIIPLIVALTLNDFVYFEFKYEEEDFMKTVTDQAILNNPEVSRLFKDMEMSIINLMKETGVINEDMAKVIEMQSKNIQNNIGNLNQTNYGEGLLGGVLPGSNPIQLLQNQQKHQFDQMQKGKK